MSYAASIGVVIVGISVGWFVESINHVIQWITAALWGGYTASNVLKWYWWRFNGYGYFWGMVTGIGPSLAAGGAQRLALTSLSALNAFPLILLVSLVGCFAGTLLTPAEDEQVLKAFYRQVRPWGFWGPILAKVRQEDPALRAQQGLPARHVQHRRRHRLADEPGADPGLPGDPEVRRGSGSRWAIVARRPR